MPGVYESSAACSKGQVSVVEATVDPAALSPTAELIVQTPLMDPEVFHDPLGLEGPAVGPHGMEVFKDLFV